MQDHPVIEALERTGEPYPDKEHYYILYCSCCDEGIEENEYYYEIGGEIYCENCVKDSRHIA
jgi:hypothetical protein